VITNNKNIFIEKRTGKDIWQDLYQFPLLEFGSEPTNSAVLKKFTKEMFEGISAKKFSVRSTSVQKKHQLSHQTILARFWQIELHEQPSKAAFKQILKKDLKKYPFPVLIDNHFRELDIFDKN
jgi:A/G-specific adenine glycosylase